MELRHTRRIKIGKNWPTLWDTNDILLILLKSNVLRKYIRGSYKCLSAALRQSAYILFHPKTFIVLHTCQEGHFNHKKIVHDFWANFLISGIIVVAKIAINNFWDNGPLRKWAFFQFDCYLTNYYTMYYKNACISVTYMPKNWQKMSCHIIFNMWKYNFAVKITFRALLGVSDTSFLPQN